MKHANWSWLYYWAAGFTLGLLLSDGGMGRVSPAAHAALFGASAEHRAVVDFRKESLNQFHALQSTGVTESAISEHIAQRYEAEQVLMAQEESAMSLRVSLYMVVIVVAVVLIYLLKGWSLLSKPTATVSLSVCSGLCLMVMCAWVL